MVATGFIQNQKTHVTMLLDSYCETNLHTSCKRICLLVLCAFRFKPNQNSAIFEWKPKQPEFQWKYKAKADTVGKKHTKSGVKRKKAAELESNPVPVCECGKHFMKPTAWLFNAYVTKQSDFNK